MAENFVNIEDHYESNARHLRTTVVDSNGVVVDLTGATAEYVIKDSEKTDDVNAYLTLSGTQGGISSGITFDADPTTGKLIVEIATGDTLGIVADWSVEAGSSVTKYHRLDVTDSAGRKITGFVGDFEILAD